MNSQPDLEFTNRCNIPSSRAFSNRLNTLHSNQENLRDFDDEDNFVTVAAVTPSNNIRENDVDRYFQYSKKDLKEHSYLLNNRLTPKQGKFIKKGSCLNRKKISRNSSMVQFSTNRNGASLRNTNNYNKYVKKAKPSYRRKSFGSLKMANSGHSTSKGHYYIVSQHFNTAQRCHNRMSARYGSVVKESATQREPIGEYSYGRGGASFAKKLKVSKFDEDRDRIYSPGPAKYVPRTTESSTKYSFGKQKKEFSFVRAGSRDVPSPGKYKIKRDFVSKKAHD